MRITHRMTTDSLIQDLRSNQARLETLQGQLSSGKRIERPSDDPWGVERALAYRGEIAAGEQFVRNMDGAQAWLAAGETALDSATTVLQRARELAVQGSNDAFGTDQQQAAPAEVDQILQEMVKLGNSSLRGQRLFAGNEIDADPFALNAGPPTTVTYTGNSATMPREIAHNSTVDVNVPGDTAFTSSFAALIKLRDDLNAGNTAAVSGDLATVDGALDDIIAARAELGARTNRIDAARDRQTRLQGEIEELLSKIEDTDYAETISRYSSQEAVYKAALATGARAVQPSLLDYLR